MFHGNDERVDQESLDLSTAALARARRGAPRPALGPAGSSARSLVAEVLLERLGERRRRRGSPPRRRPSSVSSHSVVVLLLERLHVGAQVVVLGDRGVDPRLPRLGRDAELAGVDREVDGPADAVRAARTIAPGFGGAAT